MKAKSVSRITPVLKWVPAAIVGVGLVGYVVATSAAHSGIAAAAPASVPPVAVAVAAPAPVKAPVAPALQTSVANVATAALAHNDDSSAHAAEDAEEHHGKTVVHRPGCRHFRNGVPVRNEELVTVAPIRPVTVRGSLAKRALHALELGLPEEALALSLRGTERNPEDAEAWLVLASAHAQMGHHLAAREAYGSCVLKATGPRAGECVDRLKQPSALATSQ